MSELANCTGKFRAYRNKSNDNSATKVTRRPRDSLVCDQCRKSKLRCDRRQPCNSCIRRNGGIGCSYKMNHSGSKTASAQYPGITAEDRLTRLESLVKQIITDSATQESSNDHSIAAAATNTPAIPETSQKVSANGHKSSDAGATPKPELGRYVGSTHWSAVLEDLHELKIALGESSNGLNMAADSVQSGKAECEFVFDSANNYSLEYILSQSLPPKEEVDHYVETYFDAENFVIPFIHRFQFQSQYQAFWADISKVNPLWLSMLFSMCYLSNGVLHPDDDSQRSAADDHDPPSRSSQFRQSAAQCLVLGAYYRPQLFTCEALVMYAYCKMCRSLDPSRESGMILSIAVRLAYEMGYHRDPDTFGTFTPFESEMRRRLWTSCKQLDLMLSFQLGIPSNICLENSDTKSPRHLLDTDFGVDTEVLPVSQPSTVPSKLFWIISKDKQLEVLGKVCKDALSFNGKSEAEIWQMDREIRQIHETTPDVLRMHPWSESVNEPPFLILTRIFTEFLFLKSICVLHRRYMAQGSVTSARKCIEAGHKIVTLFTEMYDEFSPGGLFRAERLMLNSFTMNDFLLGVMILCLAEHIRIKSGSWWTMINHQSAQDEFQPLLRKAYVVCVEQSKESTDAARVARAISKSLAASNSLAPNRPIVENSASKSHPSMSSAEPQSFSVSFLSIAPYQNGQERYPETERTSDFLDPFSIMGQDFGNMENIDWANFVL